MSYAVKLTAEQRVEQHERALQKRHDMKKTRPSALHRHNPAGAKLVKRFFKAKNERRPLRSELQDLMRGTQKEEAK